MKVRVQTTGGGVTVTASYQGSSLTAFGKRSELSELFGAVVHALLAGVGKYPPPPVPA